MRSFRERNRFVEAISCLFLVANALSVANCSVLNDILPACFYFKGLISDKSQQRQFPTNFQIVAQVICPLLLIEITSLSFEEEKQENLSSPYRDGSKEQL